MERVTDTRTRIDFRPHRQCLNLGRRLRRKEKANTTFANGYYAHRIIGY